LSRREHVYPERELKNPGWAPLSSSTNPSWPFDLLKERLLWVSNYELFLWCLPHKGPGIGPRAFHIIRKPSTIELYLHFLPFFFFFAAVGFELRASYLLGRHCTAQATPPSSLFFFWRQGLAMWLRLASNS
jgi:hypothetical protein